jgi:ribonuclease-3
MPERLKKVRLMDVSEDTKDPSILEDRLGHRFRDRSLLATALRHASFVNESGDDSIESNERLEFLGDAVVEICVTSIIFEKAPHLYEGTMTPIRAALVCTESLSAEASRLGIGDFLELGKGAEKQGERQNPALLEDAFEAVAGALFLDGGFDVAMAFMTEVFSKKAESYIAGVAIDGFFDHKSKFQQVMQQKGETDIRYRTIAEEGPDHAKSFKVVVSVAGTEFGEGEGKTKKSAEQEAAKAALEKSEGNKCT